MKKILALVLAFAMVFSSIPVVFADSVSDEAKALAMIGALKGDNGGVTAEYLAKAPTRLQAAIMLLRLKGLEAEAMAYVSEDNFEDVKDYPWVEGRNIMAYLKANPAVGFRGTDKGFEPNREITALEFYKVLLVSLGYVETTADVVGDFTWDTLKDKLAEVGLGALLEVTSFTNDHMAKATVEALGLKVKDSDVTLLGKLIEAGVVKEEDAIAAGLLEEAKEITVAVDSVKAIGNTVVEVVFEEDVDEAALGNIDNYAIEGLEIKDVVVTGSNSVRLVTEAMTGGKAYTLVVGGEKVVFAGKAKVSGAPTLKSAKGPDTERVELVFDKVLDFESATDVANYTIDKVTIVKAEVDGDTVTLTTEGLTPRKTYTVKVTNIASVDGAVLKSASKSFLATSDTTAPKLSKVTALTNTRIEVLFNEKVTEESATDIANYVIKDTKDNTELGIVSIEFNDDEDGVEITTESQVAGRKYELVVNNIVDQSVLANTMTKESKKSFNGIKADTTGPRLVKATAYSENRVLVEFGEDGNTRLDEATVLDVNNYEFTNDLVVESVEKLPGDGKDFRHVMLTVSDIENKSYKLYVSNVADEYGNTIKENANTSLIKGTLPKVSKLVSAVATATNKVKITFADYIFKPSATNILNYSVNNNMGVPESVKYEKDKKSVTLTFNADFEPGKKYTVTVNNIEDFGGNIISGKLNFVGVAKENDLERPTVENVEILNNKVLRVEFSEPIADASNMKVNIYKMDNLTTPFESDVEAKYVDEDGAVIEYSDPDLTFGEMYYAVEFSNDYKDKAGNVLEVIDEDAPTEDQKYFYKDVYGTDEDPEDIALEAWEQISDKKFKLFFSDKMGAKDADLTAKGMSVTVTPGVDTVSLKVDKDDEYVVVLTSTKKFTNDTEYTLDLRALKGPHGTDVKYDGGNTVKITAYFEDDEAPYIEKVEAKYNDEVVITYNEDINPAAKGTYEILDEDDKKMTFSSRVEDNEVILTLTNKTFKAGKVYTLVVKTGAKDLYGNQAEKDVEFSFEGTNLTRTANFGTVYVVNGEIFEIVPNESLGSGSYEVEVSVDGTVVASVNLDPFSEPVKKLTVDITDENSEATIRALLKGTTYTATVKDSNSNVVFTVKFEGIIEDGGITLTKVTGPSGKYEVSYSDEKANDTVKYCINGGEVEEYEGPFELTSNQEVDVWVVRDGRIVYYLQGFKVE